MSLSKCIFRFLNKELVKSKDIKGGFKMSQVLIKGRAIDKYVIKEYKYKFSKIRLKNSVHEGLESS